MVRASAHQNRDGATDVRSVYMKRGLSVDHAMALRGGQFALSGVQLLRDDNTLIVHGPSRFQGLLGAI